MIFERKAEFFGLTSSMIRLGDKATLCDTYAEDGLIFWEQKLFPGIGVGSKFIYIWKERK